MGQNRGSHIIFPHSNKFSYAAPELYVLWSPILRMWCNLNNWARGYRLWLESRAASVISGIVWFILMTGPGYTLGIVWLKWSDEKFFWEGGKGIKKTGDYLGRDPEVSENTSRSWDGRWDYTPSVNIFAKVEEMTRKSSDDSNKDGRW